MTSTTGLAQFQKRQRRQQRLLAKLAKEERWMKWLIIGLVILLVGCMLFFGYTTAWTRDIKTGYTESSTPTSTNAVESDIVNHPLPTNTSTTAGSDTLKTIYNDTTVGDNISTLASLAGVSEDCRDEVFIQVCEFTDENGQTITTRNLIGSGAITGITKNF